MVEEQLRTLEAHYVMKDAIVRDPDNKELEEKLRQRGKMFTNSLHVLNELCKPKMADY
jgi:hypothetical protein